MNETRTPVRALLDDQEREFQALRAQAHDIRVYL